MVICWAVEDISVVILFWRVTEMTGGGNGIFWGAAMICSDVTVIVWVVVICENVKFEFWKLRRGIIWVVGEICWNIVGIVWAVVAVCWYVGLTF